MNFLRKLAHHILQIEFLVCVYHILLAVWCFSKGTMAAGVPGAEKSPSGAGLCNRQGPGQPRVQAPSPVSGNSALLCSNFVSWWAQQTSLCKLKS